MESAVSEYSPAHVLSSIPEVISIVRDCANESIERDKIVERIINFFIAINIPCFEGVKVVLFVGLSMYLLLIM